MFNIQAIANDVAAAVAGKINGNKEGSAEGSGQADELPAVIASVLRKMQIVTRDEFDAQAAVLLRTRQKLEQLEQQVAALESDHLSK